MLDLNSTFNSQSLIFSGYKTMCTVSQSRTFPELPLSVQINQCLGKNTSVTTGKSLRKTGSSTIYASVQPHNLTTNKQTATYLQLMVLQNSPSFLYILNLPQSSFSSNYTLPNMEKEITNNDETEDRRRQAEAPDLIQMIRALHD